MKKSEVIKLMKEGTHCIYNDCPEKEDLLIEILYDGSVNTFDFIPRTHYFKSKSGGVYYHHNRTGDHKTINLSEIEPDNEKPYLYFEGEKYYFGETYEFSDDKDYWERSRLLVYRYDVLLKFETVNDNFRFIRKIDHTTKYKKLLLELKEQAEKDGVNLKELI